MIVLLVLREILVVNPKYISVLMLRREIDTNLLRMCCNYALKVYNTILCNIKILSLIFFLPRKIFHSQIFLLSELERMRRKIFTYLKELSASPRK